MRFLTSAYTDIGIKRKVNQDVYAVQTSESALGPVAFGVLCDGMGGLSEGEVASDIVRKEFLTWFEERFPYLSRSRFFEDELINQWNSMVQNLNQDLGDYGKNKNIRLGTTLTAILVMQNKYYIVHVGDTRAYEIGRKIKQITRDQTLVDREVSLGHITKEEAKTDVRRNILLQCVGASSVVCPEIYVGETKLNAIYMLCSDGFRHKLSKEEIHQQLHPLHVRNEKMMRETAVQLVELNKSRFELDNISVLLIRTCR